MPRIWLLYAKFLQKKGRVTLVRRVFDRSFHSLPIGQHYKIWPQFIDFINEANLPELGHRIFKRYIKVISLLLRSKFLFFLFIT